MLTKRFGTFRPSEATLSDVVALTQIEWGVLREWLKFFGAVYAQEKSA